MRHARYSLAGLMVLVLSLVMGCAALQEGDIGAKTAIQFATLKVIDEDADRANRVYEVVQEVKGFVDEEATGSLDGLEERVRAEIRWDQLDQAEALVVSNLVDAVRVEIQDRISDGVLDPDERVVVINVLNWIQEAAQIAGGGASNELATKAVARADANRLDRAGREPPVRNRSGPGPAPPA